jgi:hypothetical protein
MSEIRILPLLRDKLDRFRDLLFQVVFRILGNGPSHLRLA